MESNETAASKQTDEPLPTQNRTFSPEERASLGFGLDTSLAIQKDLTSTLRQDLKFFERQIMRRQRDIERATEQAVRLHEDITRWKGEEKDAGERIAYLESYLRDLQDVEVKMEVLSAHMKG
ncbi:hypothetical protein D6C90_03590 [Aureobasidium pullulans]|uniref:Uncharacterized protein n=1 Tax=Aureobasidium pullulans TaxID=5580 RepID=A0A4S8TN20_AURPU|nr:hypothetical protein D6D29_01876 [Aureobasidium pullulans]THZ49010.1 hypothetical protein D6C90_03590 [Aureobasidium pullulans]